MAAIQFPPGAEPGDWQNATNSVGPEIAGYGIPFDPAGIHQPYLSEQWVTTWDGGAYIVGVFDLDRYAADVARVNAAIAAYFSGGDAIFAPWLLIQTFRDPARVADPWTFVAAAWAAWTSQQGWNHPIISGFWQIASGTAPNYSARLAAAMGMSPHQFYGEFWPTMGYRSDITNPFVGSGVMLDALISYLGLVGNEKVMDWRNSVQAALESGGDAWVASQGSQFDLLTLVKAVGWAMLPLAIGAALTGVTTTAALGFEGATFGGAELPTGLDVISGTTLEAPAEAAWLGEVAGETSLATAEASTLSVSQVYDAAKTILKIESTLSQDHTITQATAPVAIKTASGATVVASPAYASPSVAAPSYAAPSVQTTPLSYVTEAGRVVSAALAFADPATGALSDSLTGESLYTIESAGAASVATAAGMAPWILLGVLGVALLGRRRK
jgi:hypothetical protein